MAEIRIYGGNRLKGELRVQGSKNAVLPVLAAAVIHPGITVLDNVPRITDVESMLDILRHLEARVCFKDKHLIIDASHIISKEIPPALAERTRASVLFLGSLLARFGKASLFSPGGCSIGNRPIDLHLKGLRQMGACITENETQIRASLPVTCRHIPDRHGNKESNKTDITLFCPSVGATEQLLIAASGTGTITTLRGCAKEPEIAVLCNYLVHIGAARIHGIGSDTLIIHPETQNIPGISTEAVPPPFLIPGDRIAAATYMSAAAVTGGEIILTGISPDHLSTPITYFRKMGCCIKCGKDHIYLKAPRRLLAIPHLETAPYPGFPTDMQSLFLALNAISYGHGSLTENIFENRFLMVEELKRMGAQICVSDNTACYSGVRRLHGCRVHGTDLRSGAGLITAALAAEGETIVSGYEYVLRGYEDYDKNLRHLGANVLISTDS